MSNAAELTPDIPRGMPFRRTNTAWRRYVAIGDSFTEGLADADPEVFDRYVGWADRLAAALASLVTGEPGFRYANLAVRGRLVDDVAGRQVEEALALRPDLVSIVGGGNDLLRPGRDADSVAARIEDAVKRLRASGADVLLSTPTDVRDAPVMRMLRPRQGYFSAHIWSIARRHGCAVIDQWGMPALRRWSVWDTDRLHMTSEGHARVAGAALSALGVERAAAMDSIHPDWATPPPPDPVMTFRERRQWNARWVRESLVPWVGRRVRGTSSGDGRTAKLPELTPWPPTEPGPPTTPVR